MTVAYRNVGLPPAVHEMAAKIAAYEGVSMAHLITHMLYAEADAINFDNPTNTGMGVTWHTADGVPLVALHMAGAPLTVLTLPEAEQLAAAIKQTVATRSKFSLTTSRAGRQIAVFRRGRGVTISINGIERSFTVGIASEGVAAEIARQVLLGASLARALPEVAAP
jgi:hypothetical protein